MHRFARILLLASSAPLPEKLGAAVDLARRNDAALVLYDVVDPLPARRRMITSATGARDLQALRVEQREQELHELASRLDVPRIELAVGVGIPHLEVIRRVQTTGVDLVITAVDAPRRSRLAGAATTMRLLRKCPVPVWVHSARSSERTGVAVAVGSFEPASQQLNRTLLQLGSSLAARSRTALHLIHAWRLEGETMLRRAGSGVAPQEVERLLREEERTAAEMLRGLTDELEVDLPQVEHHLVKGVVAGPAIVDVVERVAPRTLVIGTVARTGIRGLIMGNTAEQVLGRTDTSVLAVKPEGFTSPVEP